MKKIIILVLCLVWAHWVNAQVVVPIERFSTDTVLHNQFMDYIEWAKQNHKKRLEELDGEKYQMVYVDKYIVDREHHKVYIFSSYDLYWKEELGIGLNFYFRHPILKRRKLNEKRKRNLHYTPNHSKW